MAKKKKSQKQVLNKDLKDFSNDCKEVLEHHELVEDEKFLQKLAKHIVRLEEDTSFFDNDNTRLVHYYLTTPMGAPFISSKSLLEAALSYDYQDPLLSDLHEIVDKMIHFGSQKNNPLVLVFNSIEEHLKEEL